MHVDVGGTNIEYRAIELGAGEKIAQDGLEDIIEREKEDDTNMSKSKENKSLDRDSDLDDAVGADENITAIAERAGQDQEE